jgi:hypothetical protein
MFAKVLRKTHVNDRTAARRRPALRFRASVEGLESRLVLSTLTVTSNLDDGSKGTLRSAISKAKAGDVIQFDPLDFMGRNSVIHLTAPLVLYKSLTITGIYTPPVGPRQPVSVTLDGGGTHRVLKVTDSNGAVNVMLNHLTIDHGHVTDGGGGILIVGSKANLTIVDCTIAFNDAVGNAGAPGVKGADAYGGGIYDSLGTLVIQNSRIDNNSATGGMGGSGVSGANGGSGAPGGNAYGGGIYSFQGHITLKSVPVAIPQQPMQVEFNDAVGGLGGPGLCQNNGQSGNGGDGGDGHGGGICLNSPTSKNRGTLITNGGEIDNNHAIGGNGQMGAIGAIGAPGGGAGGLGGNGGNGGNATGGGIELENYAALTSTGTMTDSNDAKPGSGGMGGAGGIGGVPTPVVPVPGPGGTGGNGGNSGDAFGGAIYVASVSVTGTYTGGSIANNTVTAGEVGPKGFPGPGVPPGGFGALGKAGKVKNGAVSKFGGAKPPKPVIAATTKVQGNTP